MQYSLGNGAVGWFRTIRCDDSVYVIPQLLIVFLLINWLTERLSFGATYLYKIPPFSFSWDVVYQK